MTKTYRIAVPAGDGIGKEVMPEGLRALGKAHDAILQAIEQVLVEGPRSADPGGTASTTEMGAAIAARI